MAQANYSEVLELSERYARALFELARDKNVLPQIAADLESLVKAISSSPQLESLLKSPVASRVQVQAVFVELTKKMAISEITAGVIKLLVKNRRTGLIESIRDAFQKKLLKHKGIMEAEVHSAIRLSPESLKQVEKALMDSLKSEIRLTPKVMPEILGGIRVKAGPRLFDGSLATKIDKLELSLKEGLRRNQTIIS